MGTTVKGKLVQQGKNIMVELPTRKGTAKFAIPEKAKRFRDADFEEGKEADVERDDANRIIKVTIPGEAEIQPQVTTPKTKHPSKKGGRRDQRRGAKSRRTDNRAVKDLPKASATVVGQPFHNPYTFIRFEKGPVRERRKPTLATADELPGETDRMTGVLHLCIETQSPLMTCSPSPEDSEADHKTYRALTIADDVIVPATGIRGALRTLMTILTSGTLGYLDRTAFLIQGRDLKLGPRGPSGGPEVPEKVFLGQVERAGNANFSGTIRLGETRLIKLRDLEKLNVRLNRPPFGKPMWVKLDENDRPTKVSSSRSDDTPWCLRLSGRPVGGRRIEEKKSEAVFKPGGKVISVPAKLWADYAGRHAFGDRPSLRKEDLVWLEPAEGVREIGKSADISSLQWARWGKRGHELKEKIPRQFHPDAWNGDGKVDEVTDLFGQVADQGTKDKVESFAGRVLPENLVFEDAKPACEMTVLAPLAPPHAGCLAFYRDNDDPDVVDFEDMLRGYKVYRTTSEQGDAGSWNYAVQGVYDKGKLKSPQQKVNKTVELVPAGQSGSLRITFHALTQRELALLVQACSIPWRLGGGKPLGLGLCQVSVQQITDELGGQVDLADWLGNDWQQKHVDDIQGRVQMWVASQQPVDRMRYPRAVRGNSRGGHAWFQQFAKPRMVSAGDDGKREGGLAPIYIDGKLKEAASKAGEPLDSVTPMIAGQALPFFDPNDPDADVLFGYDVIGQFDPANRNFFTNFEEFDEQKHDLSSNVSHRNQGKNAKFRKGQKKRHRGS